MKFSRAYYPVDDTWVDVEEWEWTRLLQQTADRYCLIKLGPIGDDGEAIS